jgi:hypothetical protein
MRIAGIVFVLLFTTNVISGCNNLKFESRWRDRDIFIDGLHDEWENVLMFSEEKRATVGFMNDDKYLYLCLMAADEHVLKQSLVSGFTVWFDGMGNREEKFGIRYPVGRQFPKSNMVRKERSRSVHNRISEMLEDQSELAIVRFDEEEKLNLSKADEYGISLKIDHYLGRFIYELRIPICLSDINQYAVVPKDNGTVKIGFELGKMEIRDSERRPPGDGRGLPGGKKPGGGAGRRGPRGGNRPDRPEEFEIRIKVKLAKKPISDLQENPGE